MTWNVRIATLAVATLGAAPLRRAGCPGPDHRRHGHLSRCDRPRSVSLAGGWQCSRREGLDAGAECAHARPSRRGAEPCGHQSQVECAGRPRHALVLEASRRAATASSPCSTTRASSSRCWSRSTRPPIRPAARSCSTRTPSIPAEPRPSIGTGHRRTASFSPSRCRSAAARSARCISTTPRPARRSASRSHKFRHPRPAVALPGKPMARRSGIRAIPARNGRKPTGSSTSRSISTRSAPTGTPIRWCSAAKMACRVSPRFFSVATIGAT